MNLYAGAVKVAAGIAAINVYIGYEPILCLAVRNQAFLLLANRIALLRLFQRGNANIEGCAVHSGIPSNR